LGGLGGGRHATFASGGRLRSLAGFPLEEISMACVGQGELDEINVVAVAVLGQGEADLGLELDLRLG
jgi:hypothetical protein